LSYIGQNDDNMVHLFIIVYKNKYFMISNLHHSFPNVTSLSAILGFFNETKIHLLICSIFKISFWSHLMYFMLTVQHHIDVFKCAVSVR